MIPKVHPHDRAYGGPSDSERSAFVRGPKERPLRLLIDIDSTASDPITERILGFRTHADVEIREVSLEQLGFQEGGSAVLDESGPSRNRREFFGPARNNVAVIEKSGVVLDRVLDPNIDKRIVLAMFAQKGSDALITLSPQLLALAAEHLSLSNVMAPVQAVALLGLHLRLREDFVYRHFDGGRVETGSRDFYSMLSQALLPEWWRWEALCPQPGAPFEPSPAGLAEAIQIRMTRALRARDRLHGQLLREPTSDSADEVLMYFETFLVALAGTFDCATRVTAQAYAIRRPRNPSWRKNEWIEVLLQQDPTLQSLLAPDSRFRKLVDAIFLLRNTVHEETLAPLGILSRRERIERYEAFVPKDDCERLLGCAEALGGRTAWGLSEFGPEHVSIDMPLFAESALQIGLQVLNQVLAAVQVERFGLPRSDSFKVPEDIQDNAKYFLELAGMSLQAPDKSAG